MVEVGDERKTSIQIIIEIINGPDEPEFDTFDLCIFIIVHPLCLFLMPVF